MMRNRQSYTGNIVGKLKRLPDLRQLPPNNTPYCEIVLEVNGQQFPVSVTGPEAEDFEKRAMKGDRVAARGVIEQEQWETEHDGLRQRQILRATLISAERPPRKRIRDVP